MTTCTGSTFPNEFSSSSVWQFVGVYDAELPCTWWTTVRPSPTSSVVSIYVPPVVVSSWCRVTVSTRSAVGPSQMSWNSLSNSLHESACDDSISDDCFKHSLKTFLLSGHWRTERSRGVYDSALYKCTFLTYLLTYIIILQGSVATRIRCRGMANDFVIANLLLSVTAYKTALTTLLRTLPSGSIVRFKIIISLQI